MNGIRDSDVFLEIIEKRLGSRKNRGPYEMLRDYFEDRRKRATDKMHDRLQDLSLQEFPSRAIGAITERRRLASAFRLASAASGESSPQSASYSSARATGRRRFSTR